MSSPDPLRPQDPAGTIDPEQSPGAHLGTGALLAVALGGALGTWLRAYLTADHSGTGIPWSVVVVNVAGSAALGLGLETVPVWRPGWTTFRPLFAAGVCGGLTTFSTLTAGTDVLAYRGHAGTALAYLGISLVVGLVAAAVGLRAGRLLAGANS